MIKKKIKKKNKKKNKKYIYIYIYLSMFILVFQLMLFKHIRQDLANKLSKNPLPPHLNLLLQPALHSPNIDSQWQP